MVTRRVAWQDDTHVELRIKVNAIIPPIVSNSSRMFQLVYKRQIVRDSK